MKRLMMLLAVLLAGVIVMPGCTDTSSDDAAAEFGVQSGQRPKTREQRPPPGPREGSFQEGDEDQLPEDSPDEPSDD